MRPFFTIAIPTYSRIAYLKEAIHSILEQTYQNFEVCLSQDPTPSGLHPEVLKWSEELAKENERIRIRVNARNRGLSGNWNELVQMAQGEYIIILGDDDKLLPTYLEEMARLIHDHKVDVAFSNQIFIDSEGQKLEKTTNELNDYYGRSSLPNGIIQDPIKVVLKNSVPMSAAVSKTELLKELVFKEDLNTPEIEVFLRLAVKGHAFAYADKPLAHYRIHPQSATSSGLTIDRLLGYMHDIEVPQNHEIDKKAFFSDKMVPAVNLSLRRGDKELAIKLLSSNYYPFKPLHRTIQYICLYLPAFIRNKIV